MKNLYLLIVLQLIACCIYAQKTSIKNIDFKVDSVLKLMTLDEKIGQLNQLCIDFSSGPLITDQKSLEKIVVNGQAGSFFYAADMDLKIKLQKIAMNKSRMKIPLMFALDVIHGYKIVAPIPLAQSCSWDLAAIEKSERVSAEMSAAHGLHWTFTPMMDVTRDPRWGRVMEGSGEDSWLGAKIAVARVNGLQGNDLSKNNTVLACAKHLAGYGGAESGREYNSVEMSERQLREFYLPPFKAAVEAGVGSIMTSFNTISAVPSVSNKHLVKDILKTEWNYKGFVVSDMEAIGELLNHGIAEDTMDAAATAMNNQAADMDMSSVVYHKSLKKLVQQGKVKESYIDDACKRILRIKFALGLFQNPMGYFDKNRRDASLKNPEYQAATMDMAKKSLVLLKNEGNILPLSKKTKTIALIGPFADGKLNRDYMSTWTYHAEQKDVITLLTGIKSKLDPNSQILVASVCGFMGDCKTNEIENAVKLAKMSDVVILAIGENGDVNGECKSRTNLDLPGNQKELVKAIMALGKPTVAVLFNGRPLTLEWESKNIPAILEAWQPGTQAGNAVAEVLFGDYNPSGKLTMSFPINVGQIPVYYNQLPTGRTKTKPTDNMKSTFMDIPNEPIYPFGFGLSYTTFDYSDITLSNQEITATDTLTISVKITNTGKVAGEEIVQLYIRDLVADISRPVKELRGFEKILLNTNESKIVKFKISLEDLKYWNADLVYKADKGKFKVMIGPNSADTKEKIFSLK